MLSHGIPPIIVAGRLGHSLAILMTTYAHYIPETQDEAARVMDDILTPISIDLRGLEKYVIRISWTFNKNIDHNSAKIGLLGFLETDLFPQDLS